MNFSLGYGKRTDYVKSNPVIRLCVFCIGATFDDAWLPFGIVHMTDISVLFP